MARTNQRGSDIKSHLVSQICSISTASIVCAHRQYRNSGRSVFIDWYRLLGVEENAGVDVIRKRYHKLALQLHPDKNKHPKAEVAFKLVSQAYVCLSDNAKRRAFDSQRLENFCPDCNRIPYTNGNSPSSNSSPSVPKPRNPSAWTRSCRILQSFKDIMRERFREEARVIENCLRTKMGSRIESPVFGSSEYLSSGAVHKTREETPIFDPSDNLFQGYPHLRSRIYRKPEHCWFLQRGNSLNCEQGRLRFDYPIFEIRSDIRMFKSKSACVYS